MSSLVLWRQRVTLGDVPRLLFPSVVCGTMSASVLVGGKV